MKIVSSWNDEVKLNRAAPQRKCTSLLAVAKPDLVPVFECVRKWALIFNKYDWTRTP